MSHEQEEQQRMNASVLTPLDIGIIDKTNADQMQYFLQINGFEIPNNIPRDADNHSFAYRLLTKNLPNGETCSRDWICWSVEKQSLYCAPCFLFNKTSTSIISDHPGWNISRGLRKLKDRIPSHENLLLHK